MLCHNCRNTNDSHNNYCQYCGHKLQKTRLFPILLIPFFVVLFFSGIYFFMENYTSQPTTTIPEKTREVEREESPRNLVVNKALKTVYTIYTDRSQGSAFLYDENGSIVTNAHVVEGEVDVTVKTRTGDELSGKVIGYSNDVDIAVIDVPDLKGKTPFPLDKINKKDVGEKVIALGAPFGRDNTATFGRITGIDYDLVMDEGPHTYKNLYQVSTALRPGNSGGPLISNDSEKIIAINTAQSLGSKYTGFSIPLYQVTSLIDSWIESPMSEDDIFSLFYDADGNYFYEYLWEIEENEEFYFDGGNYKKDAPYDKH